MWHDEMTSIIIRYSSDRLDLHQKSLEEGSRIDTNHTVNGDGEYIEIEKMTTEHVGEEDVKDVVISRTNILICSKWMSLCLMYSETQNVIRRA